MAIRVITKSNKAFIVVGKALMKTQEGLRKGLHEIGIIAKREAKSLILNPPKTGKIRRIRGVLHQASAGGEAPATFTGNLARNLGYKVSSPTQLVIFNKAPYSGWLEEGTKKMEARPFLSAAAKNTAKEAENAMLMATQREFN